MADVGSSLVFGCTNDEAEMVSLGIAGPGSGDYRLQVQKDGQAVTITLNAMQVHGLVDVLGQWLLMSPNVPEWLRRPEWVRDGWGTDRG